MSVGGPRYSQAYEGAVWVWRVLRRISANAVGMCSGSSRDRYTAEEFERDIVRKHVRYNDLYCEDHICLDNYKPPV